MVYRSVVEGQVAPVIVPTFYLSLWPFPLPNVRSLVHFGYLSQDCKISFLLKIIPLPPPPSAPLQPNVKNVHFSAGSVLAYLYTRWRDTPARTLYPSDPAICFSKIPLYSAVLIEVTFFSQWRSPPNFCFRLSSCAALVLHRRASIGTTASYPFHRWTDAHMAFKACYRARLREVWTLSLLLRRLTRPNSDTCSTKGMFKWLMVVNFA